MRMQRPGRIQKVGEGEKSRYGEAEQPGKDAGLGSAAVAGGLGTMRPRSEHHHPWAPRPQ